MRASDDLTLRGLVADKRGSRSVKTGPRSRQLGSPATFSLPKAVVNEDLLPLGVRVLVSQDGSVLYKRSLYETVRFPSNGDAGPSVCVSVQQGCSLEPKGRGCRFCSTGTMVRFTGNLSAQQIAGQVLLALDTAPDGQAERIRVVFAGMGESTFNAKGVVGAMVLLQEKLPDQQIDFVVVSIGTPPKALQKLGDLISNAFEESRLNLGTQVYLQLSLHAATDAKRKFLIPMAEVDDEFQIRNVVRGALSFRDRVGLFVEPYLLHQDPFPDRLMVTLNYLMLGAKGIDFEGNARPEDLRALIDLVREFGVKNFIIKLSHYNADRRDGHSFAVVTDEVAQHWLEALQDAGIFAIRFNSLATDVRGGCGQLTADEVAEMMHPAAVRELR